MKKWTVHSDKMCNLISNPVRILFLLLALVASATAHYKPMVDHGFPKPPPTVDPGPQAALLRVTILDAGSGERASATVSVNNGDHEPDNDPFVEYSLRRSANRHKGPIRFRQIPYYFYTDGYFEVRVPPGKVTLQVGKGYEFRPEIVILEVSAHEIRDLAVSLKRNIDMASMNWYSGDTHIHMSRTGDNDEHLLAVTSAKDIRYAFLLSMNTNGYDQGGEQYESVRQLKGLGDKTVASKGPYHISSGQEYRAKQLGHVTIVLPDEYVPASGYTDNVDLGPSLAVIADQVHHQRGFIAPAHGGYHNQEVDGLLLENKMDFLELLQFGGYRSLGLDGWYDFLNVGYRLPIVGASDFPPTRELASEMTYAWCDEVPTPRSWMEAIAAGRSFATSGPLLFLTVDGHRPGALIEQSNPSSVHAIHVGVQSPIYPVRYLEVIVNGNVVERLFDPLGRNDWQLQTSIRLTQSSWIAVRAYGDAGTDAHTNPVYVYVDGKLRFDPDSARNIVTRLEGSISQIELPSVVAKLELLKSELNKMIEGQSSDLPLPSIPGRSNY